MIQRRQAWLMAGLSVGAAIVFLGMLSILVLLSFQSPLDWLLALVNRLADTLTLLEIVQRVAYGLNQAAPLSAWAAVSGLLTLIGVLWAASLQKHTQAWRVSE